MKILHQADQFTSEGQGVTLAIGMFDGVHLGHQHVLRQTVADAARFGAVPLAITFDRHPNSVVAPERTTKRILSVMSSINAISSAGQIGGQSIRM